MHSTDSEWFMIDVLNGITKATRTEIINTHTKTSTIVNASNRTDTDRVFLTNGCAVGEKEKLGSRGGRIPCARNFELGTRQTAGTYRRTVGRIRNSLGNGVDSGLTNRNGQIVGILWRKGHRESALALEVCSRRLEVGFCSELTRKILPCNQRVRGKSSRGGDCRIGGRVRTQNSGDLAVFDTDLRGSCIQSALIKDSPCILRRRGRLNLAAECEPDDATQVAPPHRGLVRAVKAARQRRAV